MLSLQNSNSVMPESFSFESIIAKHLENVKSSRIENLEYKKHLENMKYGRNWDTHKSAQKRITAKSIRFVSLSAEFFLRGKLNLIEMNSDHNKRYIHKYH